jgi:hypothetical protein
MRIGVVLPSVPRREELLLQTRQAYEESTDIELSFVCPIDPALRGIGKAWNAGVAALEDVDYIHLSADDIIPSRGWAEAAVDAADRSVYPSPRLILPDGSLESCGTLGGGFYLPEVSDGTPAVSSGLPFFAASLWEHIEPVPEVHYYADDFIAFMARSAGLRCQVVRAYEFTLLGGQIGRQKHIVNSMRDRAAVTEEMGRRSKPLAESLSAAGLDSSVRS